MDPLVISMDGGTFANRLITPINLPVSRSFSGSTGIFPAGPMSTAVPKSVAPPRSFTFNKCLNMSISLIYVFLFRYCKKPPDAEIIIRNRLILTSAPDIFSSAGSSSGCPLATAKRFAEEASRDSEASNAFILLNKAIFCYFLF